MSTLSRTASSIFSPDGALGALTGYEHRPQQEQMSEAIGNALERRQHLIVEAPTGVGKTLAYLVPAILYSLNEDRKAIVSTHTKNLQEQIFRKDIPLVHAILQKDFRVAVLKGRRNYLCTTRLRNALGSTALLFEKTELDQLHRIRDWSRRTLDGDMENLGFVPDARVWDLVCSEREVCSSSLCKADCFFQQTKERVRSADLVIMNHALFFTLLAMQESESHFLFENDFVVFDEAHTLEAVAGVGLGKNLSRFQALAAVHKLYNARSKRGLLARDSKTLLLLCSESERLLIEFFDRMKQAALRIAPAMARGQNHVAREIRIRTPRLIANTVAGVLGELQNAVHRLEESSAETRKPELAAARHALWEAGVLIDEFLEQRDDDFTYWLELSGNDSVTLCASPTEIAERIGRKLFREDTSVIMTSATLTVNGSLEYFKSRMGAGEVGGVVLDSPFDHMGQMRLTLARDLPEPDRPDYINLLPARILQGIDRTHGKALVLFTNSALLQAMAARLSGDLEGRGWKLLVQGGGLQRHELLEEFKGDIHSVLFGLDSFWMGVDVPGEALEHVIITRLPFAVPNHPLTEARFERIEERGGNAFLDFSLPEAVLKFRQGVGRLLRSRTDKGMVTILDSRILTKHYGRMFISSIPRCPVEVISADGEVEYLPVDS
jgi:ATP-dependent DNA helicase DinG